MDWTGVVKRLQVQILDLVYLHSRSHNFFKIIFKLARIVCFDILFFMVGMGLDSSGHFFAQSSSLPLLFVLMMSRSSLVMGGMVSKKGY